MNKLSTSIELVEKNIVAEIEALKKDLDTIRRLKTRYSEHTQTSLLDDYAEKDITTSNVQGVTDAVISLMKQKPNKAWKPSELENELKKMQKQGKLISKAKNLRYAVHGALKSLFRQSRVLKIMTGKVPTYKLAQ